MWLKRNRKHLLSPNDMWNSQNKQDKSTMPTADKALPGRSTPIEVRFYDHLVLGTSIKPPFPSECERALFGMGCFWGAERCFWQMDGVYTTAVGYAGGLTPNPTYEEVCTGQTGHNEVVLVVYYPSKVTYEQLLKVFWEMHDPTMGMRQGNDMGTQYRSGIYTFTPQQKETALASQERYQKKLTAAGFGQITTEITDASTFYYAEDYHQQYLARNRGGYCNHGFCQVSYDYEPAAPTTAT